MGLEGSVPVKGKRRGFLNPERFNEKLGSGKVEIPQNLRMALRGKAIRGRRGLMVGISLENSVRINERLRSKKKGRGE